MDLYVNDRYALPLNAKFSETKPDDLLYIQPPKNVPRYFQSLYYICPSIPGMFYLTEI